MTPERAAKLDRAVAAGLRRWPESRSVSFESELRPHRETGASVVRAMPRRKQTHTFDAAHVTLPMARTVAFNAGVLRTLGRLMLWFWACIKFFGGNAIDRLTGRSSVQRRAERLRRVFEDVGASFTKLGQQLSLRADLLPYAYCVELSKMLDRARPFPTDQAIAIIERSLGRTLGEMFDAFDPVPIGAASLSCVYQARLKTGERVAVKVRRPGVGMMLAADLRALDWLLIAAETLTILRPGFTRRFREDLRTILMGELNFRAEARYTDMFRRRAKKNGDHVTAPNVYFDFCSEEVLVTEFVSGVWMWELMAAVDTQDHVFLAELAERGIEPGAVARKLVHSVYHELLEELFFHSDPHPANLVVLPDNRVCFIDFGAIGRFSTQTRNTWREMQYHMKNKDVARMVRCSITLAGPLPPIDLPRVTQAMEQIYADWVYAVSSKDAEWWERSTAQTWLRYINVARDYGLPVHLEIIQFFRATLLYDSIVTRLDKDIDFVKEWTRYTKSASKDARERVLKEVRKRLTGPTDLDYLRLEQFGDMAGQFFFKFQRSVEDPFVQFGNVVGKIAYAVSLVLRLAAVGVVIAGGVVAVDFIMRRWFGREIGFNTVLDAITDFGLVQLALVVVAVLIIRRLLIRVNEPDHKPSSERF